MKLTSLLLFCLCSLFGTFSRTEAAAVLPDQTRRISAQFMNSVAPASHGPAITSEKRLSTLEINTSKRSDDTMGAVTITDVAIASSLDQDTTTESSIIHHHHHHHETNSTVHESTNTTTDTNTTNDTDTTTDASNNSSAARSSTDTTTIFSSTGAVEAGRTHVANTGSTSPPGADNSTYRPVSTSPTTDSV